jgi:zinc D-Ala-D-Ala carboxypeptidase
VKDPLDHGAQISPGMNLSSLGDRDTISKASEDSLKAIWLPSVLQPARNKLGLPIRITSAYRSPAENAVIGGVSGSQHIFGQAVDVQPVPNTLENYKKLWDLIASGTYDQLIWENAIAFSGKPSHIHVSFVVPGLNPESPKQTE